MNAKLISGLDFHLIQNHNQIISQNLQTTPFFPSHLSFTTNISNSNPRLLLVSSFRNRATKVRAAAAETSAFYTETKTRETFYDLLGISESGTISEIKKAYKHLARKYHPDVSPPERTEEYTKRFILVQEAYETLSDPETRALYDRDLSRGLHTVFSATRRSRYHERCVESEQSKTRWQSQLEELVRRSKSRGSNRARSEGRMSWGAQMRSRRQSNANL